MGSEKRKAAGMSEITLLDGGMGQELVHRSGKPAQALWSTQVMIDHPGMVVRVHLAAASDRHLGRLGFDRDQRGRVVVLVLIGQLLVRMVVFHRPFEDFLPLRFLRRQAQPLEGVHNRRIEAVSRGMTNREAHQLRNL